jgi:CRP/FNR family transcriptional regulator
LKDTNTLSPEAITAALKKSLVFSGLSGVELAGLARLAGVRCLEEGEYAFWEGDAPDYFYILVSGRIKVLKHSSQGKEVIIAFFGPGEMFGEVAVFEGKAYPATSQAAVDSQVAAIRRDDLLSFLTAHPQVVLRIINILGGRLREAQGRLKDLTTETAIRILSRLKDGGIISSTRGEITIIHQAKLRLLSEGPPQV